MFVLVGTGEIDVDFGEMQDVIRVWKGEREAFHKISDDKKKASELLKKGWVLNISDTIGCPSYVVDTQKASLIMDEKGEKAERSKGAMWRKYPELETDKLFDLETKATA